MGVRAKASPLSAGDGVIAWRTPLWERGERLGLVVFLRFTDRREAMDPDVRADVVDTRNGVATPMSLTRASRSTSDAVLVFGGPSSILTEASVLRVSSREFRVHHEHALSADESGPAVTPDVLVTASDVASTAGVEGWHSDVWDAGDGIAFVLFVGALGPDPVITSDVQDESVVVDVVSGDGAMTVVRQSAALDDAGQAWIVCRSRPIASHGTHSVRITSERLGLDHTRTFTR